MNVVIKSKRGTHFANGIYKEGRITVLKGGKINQELSFDKMSKNIIELRNNQKIVDQDGNIQKNIEFNTPTAAANFVTGRSVNGYIAWRVEDKVSLKEYLKR